MCDSFAFSACPEVVFFFILSSTEHAISTANKKKVYILQIHWSVVSFQLLFLEVFSHIKNVIRSYFVVVFIWSLLKCVCNRMEKVV